jgi:hypothetical protein
MSKRNIRGKSHVYARKSLSNNRLNFYLAFLLYIIFQQQHKIYVCVFILCTELYCQIGCIHFASIPVCVCSSVPFPQHLFFPSSFSHLLVTMLCTFIVYYSGLSSCNCDCTMICVFKSQYVSVQRVENFM